jgi:hypothetical protein
MVKQISNEETLKAISEEMVELESKITKCNPKTDNLQMIDEWMDREEKFPEIDDLFRNDKNIISSIWLPILSLMII